MKCFRLLSIKHINTTYKAIAATKATFNTFLFIFLIFLGRFYKFKLLLASSQNLFKAAANVILSPQI